MLADNGMTLSLIHILIAIKSSMEKEKENINILRLQLYQQLFIYGDVIPLSFVVDLALFEKEIRQFDNNWVIYNKHKGFNGRHGLSITSLDGGMSGEPDLQSLYEYAQNTGNNVSENQFCEPTEAFRKISSLHPLLTYFTGGLGRCRVIRFKNGGYFPPHRDQSIQFQVPDYFRILVPLNNSGRNSFYFIYDDKKIVYEPGRAYLFNALKEHSVFSFQDDVYTFAMSLQLNQKNIEQVIRHFWVK